MKRYIALLRGINISGKNQISMPELKECLSAVFDDARTHLNSGNVIFSADESNERVLADRIRKIIEENFDLDIPVYVIGQERLKNILENAPEWWDSGDRQIYDNLIFVLPGSGAEQIREKIGEPSEGLERICIFEDVIFWSFDRQKYGKANWWKKTAGAGIGELLTIRTANTLKKIAEM